MVTRTRSPHTNLPQQLTSFVGRERERAEVARLLGETRLLTLTGTGGTGKTRLALRVAEDAAEGYPSGVWLVELAALADPALVPQAVASALGVRETPDQPVTEALQEYLRESKALLILDNCEHLLAACAQLVTPLLRSCPDLTVLSTGRAPLGVAGECAWQVPPLQVPAPEMRAPSNPEEAEPWVAVLGVVESVRLFVERARLRRSDFTLNSHNADAVAQLCYHLDGIPLAIELAAARVNVLSPEQIVVRLSDRFRLLTWGSHSTQAKQQTLTALMDWSYELLSVDERRIFRSLSVFAGGLSLEAACTVWEGGADEYATLDLLSHLVDKSLLLVEEVGDEVRYRLLETVRHYAWGKMEAAGEAEKIQERHARYYLKLAGRSQDELLTERQGEWLTRLEMEHDNLRAAVSWYHRTAPGGEMELLITGALVWFWYFRGYVSEARRHLEAALKGVPPGSAEAWTHASVLTAAGVMAYLQSDFMAARTRLEAALAIWRDLADRRGTAFALAFLGRVLSKLNDRVSIEMLEEAAALFRELGESWGLALALDFLGTALVGAAWTPEDDRRVMELHEESIALYRQMGHRWGVALELSNFGRVAFRQGNYLAARDALDEALATQREVGDKWMLAWTLLNRGDVARHEGDEAYAEELYEAGLALFRELGDRDGIAHGLMLLGRLAHQRGEEPVAAAHLTDALALFREVGDLQFTAKTLGLQGRVVVAQGDLEAAGERFLESLSAVEGLGEMVPAASAVAGLGDLAAREGDWTRAARLLGAAEALRDREHGELSPFEQEEESAQLAGVREALGVRFSAEWEAGQSLCRVALLAVARKEPMPPPSNGKYTEELKATYPHDLTEREVEVLGLVAQGLTDAQIAERLVVSVRTVQAHLRSVYSKLDVGTRSAATRAAVGLGLG